MCGIAGFLTSVPQGIEDLRRMGDAVAHRGPDDSGELLSPDGRTGFAFRRLSIIDLSPAGHQPMTIDDGAVWLVFNGEIYNFRELRHELARAGHVFRSHADSEVILHAYREWGIGCLEKLSGMFAFAIWDGPARTLLLVRDRMGIKPLFYYVGRDGIAFASEIQAIKRWRGFEESVDPTALFDFLTYLYVPAPKTIFKQLYKLPPGHYASVVGGAVQVRQYWDIDPTKQIRISRPEAEEELAALLNKAVKRHLVSDVPVGVFLSGGVDSTTVAALANAGCGGTLKSFAIGFDVQAHSEAEYAREAAAFIGTDHRELILDGKRFGALEETIIERYGEPFGDASAMPTYCLAEFTRREVTVALSGDGGDEVFGGYRSYAAWGARFSGARRFPNLSRWFWHHAGELYPPSMRGFLLVESKGLTELEYFAYLMGGLLNLEKQVVLRREFLQQFIDYDPLWYFRRYWRPDLDPVTRLQYLDLKTYLPDDILTKVDRATMAFALETRVPLLDHELVEFVFSLPVDVRLPDGRPKGLLKDAVRRLVPARILTRSKKGFSIPGSDWLHARSYRHTARPAGNSVLDARVFERNAPWLRGNKLWQVRVAQEFESSCNVAADPGRSHLPV